MQIVRQVVDLPRVRVGVVEFLDRFAWTGVSALRGVQPAGGGQPGEFASERILIRVTLRLEPREVREIIADIKPASVAHHPGDLERFIDTVTRAKNRFARRRLVRPEKGLSLEMPRDRQPAKIEHGGGEIDKTHQAVGGVPRLERGEFVEGRGMRTRSGTRMPESWGSRLCRGRPAPLSPKKKTMVFVARPSASSSRRSRPTSRSMTAMQS